MKDYSTEADARIVIDDLLRQAGWDPADKSQVLTEVSIRDTSWVISEPVAPYEYKPSRKTKDSDEIPTGRADYVLMDRSGRPLAIVEAKRSAIEPYTAKQQALPYAKKIGSPFIFLTNGELIYFWDYGNDDARIVNSFFSRRDLERLVEMRATRKPLATIEIPEYYLRQGEIRQVRALPTGCHAGPGPRCGARQAPFPDRTTHLHRQNGSRLPLYQASHSGRTR